jgi:hypothetical protein
MKTIKRLEHNATVMTDARLGWDIFWSGDYSKVDRAVSGPMSIDEAKAVGIPKGYTIIAAANLGKIRFLQRFFIRLK